MLSFIVTCGDNSFDSDISPVITTIEPTNASPGDIITIFGTNLGFNPNNAKINVSGIVIDNSQIIKWNNSFIRFNLPLNAKSGKIFVTIDGRTSNQYDYQVADKPSIEMIGVNAGDFNMGSETGFGDERPEHKVSITKSFEIGKYEVTQKIWRLVMNYNNSRIISENLPVMNVSWSEAVEFCNNLSEIFGYEKVYTKKDSLVQFNTSANGYRLPTEAEWEYACRAGSVTDFSGTTNLDNICWYNGNSAYNPHPVGTKQANAWSIFDMSGNVWEWCWDWYDENYYLKNDNLNPAGPTIGKRRVLRGGSCGDGVSYARSGNRTFVNNDFTNCGFRLVRNR
jgi:formylglycine-generating enzyme required for sulfatase activity